MCRLDIFKKWAILIEHYLKIIIVNQNMESSNGA